MSKPSFIELSTAEESELQSYRHRISEVKEGIDEGFIELGVIFSKIREKELYRQWGTLEKFAQDEYGYTRQRIHQIEMSSKVVLSLPKKLSTMVDNERTARALGKVPEEQREAVLKKAAADGTVTAAAVTEAAAELAEPPKKTIQLDHLGREVPESILADWLEAEEVQETLTLISKVRCAVQKSIDDKKLSYAEMSNSSMADINNFYTSLKLVLPYAVCTKCKGRDRDGCALCNRRGFLSKFRFDSCVPIETKEMLKKVAAKKGEK